MELDKIYRIFVKDLELFCFIGVHSYEKEKPQRILINLEIFFKKILCDNKNFYNDDIKNVVSYEDIIFKIKDLIQKNHINLVETLAEKIADLCLEDLRIQKISVSVEKPDIYQEAKSVGVEITRERTFVPLS